MPTHGCKKQKGSKAKITVETIMSRIGITHLNVGHAPCALTTMHQGSVLIPSSGFPVRTLRSDAGQSLEAELRSISGRQKVAHLAIPCGLQDLPQSNGPHL